MSTSKGLIQKMTGEGKVFAGHRFVAEVQYDIRVYQEYEETRLLSGEQTRTPTLRTIELGIRRIIQAGFDEVLTLHMSDGRKLDFYSFGGTVKPTGGFH